LIEAEGGGLAGKRIEFVGLQATITDVLVRVHLRDRDRMTTLVHPSRPWIEIAGARGPLTVALGYLASGIHHILLGVDHLLFVLGLLLVVKDRWMLVKTISAFTAAHSITLAIATLGYASVPAAPLNAAIAVSILFLGAEVVRSWRGETSLTIRHPWVVAFAFGLLHGFGFASGLTTMGLARTEIPLALLMFNVGVEAGQLLFVVLILLLERDGRMEEAVDLAAYGGLGARHPILALVLTVFMLSLIGLPPTAGFVGKFYLFSAAMRSGFVWLAVIAVLNSVVAAYYYLRLIVFMYMRDPEGPEVTAALTPAAGLALAVAVWATLQLGLWPGPAFALAQRAIAPLLP